MDGPGAKVNGVKQRVLIAIFLVMLVHALGCHQGVNSSKDTPFDENALKAAGRVVHIPLEGGFFGIVADNGSKYLPLTLPEEFKKDGLRVKFEGNIRPDIAGIHQWGTYIEVTNITAEEDP